MTSFTNVYFISGVGADSQIFRNIQLPAGYTAQYLNWIKPYAGESLENYALRLAEKIDHRKPFVLAGLSFGGMLAVEIARRYPPQQLILFSSIPSPIQMPWYFRLAGTLHVEKWVPIGLLKSASLLKRLFTAETPEEKAYLRKAIRASDNDFIRWSLHAILRWKNNDLPPACIHIHGAADEVLPVRYTSPTHVIRGGGHLMVLSRAGEINEILSDVLVSSVPDPGL